MEKQLKMGPPIIVDAETYQWLLDELEAPPRDCPKLRKIFQEERRFICGEDPQDSGAS